MKNLLFILFYNQIFWFAKAHREWKDARETRRIVKLMDDAGIDWERR
jgi:hypothetical protein